MTSDVRVICLCAGWCGTCSSFEATFDRLKATFEEVRFSWVDIEDSANLVGDYDVETFPTLLLGRGHEVVFCGPVLPQYDTISRMVRAGLDGSLRLAGTPTVDPEATRILLTLRAKESAAPSGAGNQARGSA